MYMDVRPRSEAKIKADPKGVPVNSLVIKWTKDPKLTCI